MNWRAKMAKSILELKVTELDIVKELIYICVEFYMEMPEEMRVRYDEWEDKLKESKND